MSDLLSFAVSAHGGLDRWNTFQAIEARMAVGGGIFAAKRNPGLQNNVTYRIRTHEERVAIDRFSAPDRRVNFVPSRLTLENLGGDLIEVRDDPRSAFAGQTEESPWDTLHVAYFTSYALWTYLNLPFVYTWPGVTGSMSLSTTSRVSKGRLPQPVDVVAAVRSQTIQAALGRIGSAPMPGHQQVQLTITTRGRPPQLHAMCARRLLSAFGACIYNPSVLS